jgi:hypothetical protein
MLELLVKLDHWDVLLGAKYRQNPLCEYCSHSSMQPLAMTFSDFCLFLFVI